MVILQAKFEKTTDLKTKTKITFSVRSKKDLPIMQAEGSDGYLAFSNDPFKKEVEDIMKNKKIGIREDGFSNSSTYRGKLFQIWSKSIHIKETFEEYYDRCYDELIKKANERIESCQ